MKNIKLTVSNLEKEFDGKKTRRKLNKNKLLISFDEILPIGKYYRVSCWNWNTTKILPYV